MIAVSQHRTVKTEQKRPTFKASTYVHSAAEPITLPKADCVVIVIPAQPMGDDAAYRRDTNGNPFITFAPTGVEWPDLQPTHHTMDRPPDSVELSADGKQFTYSGDIYVLAKDGLFHGHKPGFTGLKPGVINLSTSFRAEIAAN